MKISFIALTANLFAAVIATVAVQGQDASGTSASKQYTLEPTPKSITWGYYDATVPPALRIRSGDTVEIHTLITSSPQRLQEAGIPSNQIEQGLRDIYQQVTVKGPGPHILTGPIYIEEAQPGDVLEVQIRSIRLAVPYSYNAANPGTGFLGEEYPFAKMKIIPLDESGGVAHFGSGIDLPLRPFFGSMGVAPPELSGRISSRPPWIHGGNMDDKDLVSGTTVYFPIHARGALFSIGDGHAGQGHGEVDGTAMETSLWGTFRFTVRKDMRIEWPRAETPTSFIMTGFNENLDQATKIALKEMIDFLTTEKHLSRDDAYMLASVAADFSITELVDGTKGVHASIPKAIFGDSNVNHLTTLKKESK
jgi:acetamidase/formamidase